MILSVIVAYLLCVWKLLFLHSALTQSYFSTSVFFTDININMKIKIQSHVTLSQRADNCATSLVLLCPNEIVVHFIRVITDGFLSFYSDFIFLIFPCPLARSF